MPFTRSFAVLACVAGVLACADDRGELPPSTEGRPDQPSAQNLRVDEGAIRGTVAGTTLRVEVPLANTGAGRGQGELAISLMPVDGSKVLARVGARYSLGPGEASAVVAELAVPPDIAKQADWVAFNLRVESSAAPALRVTRSLLSLVAAYEVRLEGPSTVTRGRRASYRVRAQDPASFRVLAGVPVRLVVRRGNQVVATLDGTTSDKGDALFELTPDFEGEVEVEAQATAQGTTAATADSAQVERPGAKVLLTTDKPLYQPGQTIHLRALALDRSTGKPVAARSCLFEIEDGKGNKIFKRTLDSDEYGIAATRFRLGSVLNMGTFKVVVAVGPDRAEKTVTVGRYVLPKFKIDVGADRPYYTPGETVRGSVDARYFFGKPVAGGEVVIEAAALDIGQSVFQKVVGKTDGQGRYAFAVMLPAALVGLPLEQGSALVNLQVSVTDTAGQKVTQERPITVAARPLRLALVPEGTVLVPGIENRVDLFVTDPLGAPIAEAAVQLIDAEEKRMAGVTDAFGQATFTVKPSAGATFTVEARTKEGITVTEGFSLEPQEGGVPLIVRTERAVYALGDTVGVEVRTAPERQAVYVDWVNNGQTVDMRTLDVKDGVARFSVTLDPTLAGPSRIEAYVVGPDGNLVRAGRNIFVRGRGALSVALSADKPEYTPGQPAKLTFSVTDETGAPAVAALGVQIVDEAVFAIADARPGLLKTYFELEQKFSEPHYQIRPPVGELGPLLLEGTAQADPAAASAAQRRAAAMLAAMGSEMRMGIARGSWAEVGPQVKEKLAPQYNAESTRLRPVIAAAITAAMNKVKAAGCRPTEYYCQALNTSFAQALFDEVSRSLRVVDFWGNEYEERPAYGETFLLLASSGPDERPDTDDEGIVSFKAAELGLPAEVRRDLDNATQGGGPVGALPGAGSGGAGGGAANPGTGGSSGGGDEPRVRKDFPETLYVNPQLITGPDGKAQITVDMADSITEWRVSSLAHSAVGKLGGGVGAVRVFQEFFVDIDFPATLTRGDELDFPVAVYSYLDRPQTVKIELEAAPWFTARGATTHTLALAPGQVTAVRFPVRVTGVGFQKLTVKGIGEARSDAVARSVLVLPDGKAVPQVKAGSLAAGSITETVTFPESAVPGSPRLHVDIYPAYLSQAVQGMDSLLQVPNGCFEQTTSTAWPNVLVTAYLKQTNQLKPEVALKAESLMSAGYQRLLTFEHRGGGFSWFGEQDPAPFLSVTAFGLMEFADMAQVHPVDERMMERTRIWLLDQQNADGSWKGDMSEFFSFHTSLVRNTAFVVWALASAGYKGPELARGLEYVGQNMAKEKLDAYSLAMIANAAVSAAPGDALAGQALDALLAQKKQDGDQVTWDSGDTQTSFYGGGDDAKVTTTALAAHALLLAGRDKATVDGALAFLASARDAQGNFGSTQATIWTLRTLLLAARKGTEGAVGTLTVEVDGQPFTTVALTAADADVMTTVDLAPAATLGARQVTLSFAGTGKVSYNVVAQHHAPWSLVPGGMPGPLSVGVSYDKTRLSLEDIATATVTVRNNTKSRQDMVMVTVGLPPGFEVQTDDLEKYKQDKKLSSYDLTGKQVILYVSALPAESALGFSYRLRATMPVRAADGGAEAYLYYQPQQRAVAAKTTLEVLPESP